MAFLASPTGRFRRDRQGTAAAALQASPPRPTDARRTPETRAERLGGAAARIEHIAFEVDDLADVRDRLTARGVTVTWPPVRSGPNLMIWTDAASSGGVQYQFLARAEQDGDVP